MKKIIIVLTIFLLASGCTNGINSPLDNTGDSPVPAASNNSIINMKIASRAFLPNSEIPLKYTCDGFDASPPLSFSEIPANAKSLVLIVDDPDAPAGTWLHWTLFNISPDITDIEENSIPTGAVQGITSFGRPGYGGPCPPSGIHHYYFKLYALDTVLNLATGVQLEELMNAIKGHVIAQAELVGLYSRK